MTERLAINCAIDPSVHAELSEIAARWNVELDHVVATALMRFVADEAPVDETFADFPLPPPQPGLEVLDDAAAALRRFIQDGIDSIERGEFVEHDDLMAELKQRDDAALKSKKQRAA